MPWSDLYHYWRSKHSGGRPPARGEIDPPIERPSLVRNLMLIDIEPSGYRYRLVGTTINRKARRDSTGKSIGVDEFGPKTLAIWLGVLDAVTGSQAPQLLFTRMELAEKASMLTLVLPLVGRDGRTEMILSGCFYENIHAAPRNPVPLEPVMIALPYDEANG